MTPRLRGRPTRFTNAPRSLNEFVACKFSYLTSNVSVRQRGEPWRRQHGRPQHHAFDHAAGGFDIGKGNAQPINSRLQRRAPCRKDGEGSTGAALAREPLAHDQFFLHLGSRGMGISIDIKPHAYDPASKRNCSMACSRQWSRSSSISLSPYRWCWRRCSFSPSKSSPGARLCALLAIADGDGDLDLSISVSLWAARPRPPWHANDGSGRCAHSTPRTLSSAPYTPSLSNF